MAKLMGRLTDLEVRNAKPGDHGDGHGLYLQVQKSGGRQWIYRYKSGPSITKMGLGGYPVISLAAAREAALDAARLRRSGLDPLAEKRKAAAEIMEQMAAEDVDLSSLFETVAKRYIDIHKAGWKSAVHIQQWENTLRDYAYPVIGELHVNAVTTDHILQILEPIWITKTETARRLRGRLETILASATADKLRQGDNPAAWDNNLKFKLASPASIQKVEHFAAVPWRKIAGPCKKMRASNGMAAKCLLFTILTAVRPKNGRSARWEDIDPAAAIWTIPPEMMKGKKNKEREHRVPLSGAAMALLRSLLRPDQKWPTTGLIFLSESPGRALSDVAVSAALDAAAGAGYTVHGTARSSFRDWAGETGHPEDIAEAALAHKLGSKTARAYQRGDLFDRRRVLMEDWAHFCGGE